MTGEDELPCSDGYRQSLRGDILSTPAHSSSHQAQSTDEYLTIDFLCICTGKRQRGTVGWRTGPDTRVVFKVWDGPASSSTNADLWVAFIQAREGLERSGFLPLVAGARRDACSAPDVLPSAEGDHVCRLNAGVLPDAAGIVFIFDPAAACDVATVAEQAAAHDAWKRSLRAEDRRAIR